MAIKVIKIKPEFKDERGFISRIIDDKKINIKSILYIERKKGTDGANHFHKKDSHFIYILKGKVEYLEKDMNKNNAKVQSVVLLPGDMVLSKPMMAHSTVFLEDTVFMAFATEHRSQEEYEKDTVRLNFTNEQPKKD